MRRQLACNEIHVLAQTVLDLSSCVHIQHVQPLIALVGWDAASVLVTELAWMVPAHRHGSCIEFRRRFYGGTSYMLFPSLAIHYNNNTAIHSVRSWTSVRMPPQTLVTQPERDLPSSSPSALPLSRPSPCVGINNNLNPSTSLDPSDGHVFMTLSPPSPSELAANTATPPLLRHHR